MARNGHASQSDFDLGQTISRAAQETTRINLPRTASQVRSTRLLCGIACLQGWGSLHTGTSSNGYCNALGSRLSLHHPPSLGRMFPRPASRIVAVRIRIPKDADMLCLLGVLYG